MGRKSAFRGHGAAPLVALSANSAWNIVNFRRSLVEALKSDGYRVVVLVPPGDDVGELESLGVDVALVPMSPRGLSPVADGLLLLRYWRVLRKLRPAAFLSFTAKPNIYGSIAASALGIATINNITGLGTSFLSGWILERVVSGLYKIALRKSAVVYFHNPDDRDLFIGRGLITRVRSQVIPGSGIDLDRFAAADPTGHESPTFLFIGRLLVDKGIVEFGTAAAMVRRSWPDARFVVIGGWSDHLKAAPRHRLDQWANSGLLELAGNVDDVRPFIENADCVVLPSYREGLPRALLEASAMARAVIGCDVPGSREVVKDGITGYLCEAQSAPALAEAMLTFASLQSDERCAMGQRARLRAEEQFGEERVSNAYGAALASILAGHSPPTTEI